MHIELLLCCEIVADFKQTSVSTFLLFHLPAEFIQRLDMPKAFAGDGAEGQRAEEVNEKDLWNAELQSLLKGFQ